MLNWSPNIFWQLCEEYVWETLMIKWVKASVRTIEQSGRFRKLQHFITISKIEDVV